MKAKKGRKASRGEGRVCYKMLREERKGRKKEKSERRKASSGGKGTEARRIAFRIGIMWTAGRPAQRCHDEFGSTWEPREDHGDKWLCP